MEKSLYLTEKQIEALSEFKMACDLKTYETDIYKRKLDTCLKEDKNPKFLYGSLGFVIGFFTALIIKK